MTRERNAIQFDSLEKQAMAQNEITRQEYHKRREKGFTHSEAIYTRKGEKPSRVRHFTDLEYRIMFTHGTTPDTVIMNEALGMTTKQALTTRKRRR